MNFDRDTLKLIQETAVKAARAEVYDIGPRNEYRKEPPEMKNEVYEIDDAIRVFRSHPDSTIWVGPESITVLHDTKEQQGKTTVSVYWSPAAEILWEADGETEGKTMSPDEFEKVALLQFDCEPAFIQTLRDLDWNHEAKETAKISAVNKSISASELERVLQRDGRPFEDVTITVTTPILSAPLETSTQIIPVSVIPNAKEKTITFAPAPGIMRKLIRAAVRELYTAVCESLTPDEKRRVYMGTG